MICDRHGCGNFATHLIMFNRYATDIDTRACRWHATWWTRGANGRLIGMSIPIPQRGVG